MKKKQLNKTPPPKKKAPCEPSCKGTPYLQYLSPFIDFAKFS